MGYYQLMQQTDGALQDTTCWRPIENGIFTVKIAYALTKGQADATHTEDNTQAVVWKRLVSERIKTFLWLVKHGPILTNSEGLSRRLTTNPTCKWCPDKNEDLDHVFLRCPMASSIWLGLPTQEQVRNLQHAEFKDWLDGHINKNSNLGEWNGFFAVVISWI